MMQAHRAPARRYPCPGCATCRQRRDRVLAALVLLVFVAVFVAPVVLGWKP
jgi:hypothetical protein